jgi:uncharacterized YigZ family protein
MDSPKEDQYHTVANHPVSMEIKVKGSKFIGHIFHVLNKTQAESVYANIRRKYHDATHNCYAYRISENNFRYSDDGEPSGTAGIPIYKVLEGKNLIQTIIIVTRYFGGTKLGKGGLIRAYSSCAQEVLNQTKIEVKVKLRTISIQTSYEELNILLDTVNKHKGLIGKTEYTDIITYILQIPTSNYQTFKDDLAPYLTKGIKIIKED